MGDRYRSLEELMNEEREGVDYRVRAEDRNHKGTVIAPHGGGIEPGTSEVAQSVAGADLNLFVFEGIKPKGNGVLHITSTRFRHPNLEFLLKKSRVAVSIHGKEGDAEGVGVGGLNVKLATLVLRSLTQSGFAAKMETDPGLNAGLPENVVNMAREHGVQLELTRRLRSRLRGEGRLMSTFRDAVWLALSQYCSAGKANPR